MPKESEETEVKNKEWATEEIKGLETETSQNYPHDEMIKKEIVLSILNQLDELEVLSSDWIKENQLMWTSIHGAEYYVPANKLYGKPVPKRELPAIPKFVAEWIEDSKDRRITLYGAMTECPREVDYWFIEDGSNQELFAKAWLAYPNIEAEKEQKYHVTDENDTLLCKSNGVVMTVGKLWAIGNEHEAEYDLTEQEIKDYDERYFAFAVKVEELEE